MYSKNPIPESDLLSSLHKFSEDEIWRAFSPEEQKLFQELNALKDMFRFPAVKNDVGQALSFLSSMLSPKVIFEMGSGYGHSAFWYLVGQSNLPAEIHLTERREDMLAPFQNLSWPKAWKEKLRYHQGDAFLALEKVAEIDLLLLDGEKAQYLDFLQKVYSKLSSKAVIVIDNAFVKGTFLQAENAEKVVVKKTLELQQYLKQGPYKVSFLPVRDGLFLLKKI